VLTNKRIKLPKQSDQSQTNPFFESLITKATGLRSVMSEGYWNLKNGSIRVFENLKSFFFDCSSFKFGQFSGGFSINFSRCQTVQAAHYE